MSNIDCITKEENRHEGIASVFMLTTLQYGDKFLNKLSLEKETNQIL